MDKKRIYAIFAIIFTNIFGAMMILPVLALYAEQRFNATVPQATLLSTAYFGAQFIAAPRLGRLSDRYGRRPLLIISQAGTVLSFFLFIYAAELGDWIETTGLPLAITGGLLVMFIARILDGITGGNITIAQAYVTDISTPESRTQALGLLTGAFGLGFIFGPAVGGVLSGISVTAPFWGATIVTIITLLLTSVILDESLPPEKRETGPAKTQISLKEAVQNREFATLLVLGFIQSLAFSAIPATFALYAERVFFPGQTLQEISGSVGLILTYNGLITVITQTVLLKHIIRRIGERKMVTVGMICFMLALGVLPLMKNPLLAAVFFTPWAFGRGLLQPSLQSLVSHTAAPQHRGRFLGLYQSSLSLALIFGPIWSGYAFNAISPQAVFQIGALIVIPGVILSFFVQRRALPAAP